MIVTAVERQRRRRRVDVYIDGELALAIGLELAAERGVRPGRTLSPGELSALRAEEERQGALQAGLRLLSYRPRSEAELRRRLRGKGFGWPAVNGTLRRLRELGYVDDEAFARFWTETRQASRPRSARLVTGELRRQGIAAETAAAVTTGIDDEDAAHRAARRRLGALGGLEYQKFRERLGGFLTRRGFSYDVARGTVDRCWRELEASREPASDGTAVAGPP